jgi:hypothetical protein
MDGLEDIFEYEEEFDDEIWDEEQWELFMQEADKKVDEYLRRIEEDIENSEEHHKQSLIEEDEYSREELQDSTFFDSQEKRWSGSREAWKEDEESNDFRLIPAYRIAYDFGFAVYHYIKDFYANDTTVPEINHLAKSCFVISAKIAGGHGMGYDMEVLEGNIACCKRGLQAAENCVEALENLRIRNNPTPEVLELYGFALKTRNAVREWIDELRRKIWWR